MDENETPDPHDASRDEGARDPASEGREGERSPSDRPSDGRSIENDAADLSLAVVSEATAMTSEDPSSLEQSDENLREVVREKLDHPLDPQQEDVVSVLGAAGGSLAAGLSVALADARDVEPREVLQSVARAVLAQRTDGDRDLADPWQGRAEDGRDRQDAGHDSSPEDDDRHA